MIVENWKVQLQLLPGRFDKALYIYRKHGEQIEFIRPDGKAEITSWGTKIEPVLTLDEAMIHAMVEELTNSGYKPKDLGKVEGLYEAQSEHLADLRHLLKLPESITTVQVKKV